MAPRRAATRSRVVWPLAALLVGVSIIVRHRQSAPEDTTAARRRLAGVGSTASSVLDDADSGAPAAAYPASGCNHDTGLKVESSEP